MSKTKEELIKEINEIEEKKDQDYIEAIKKVNEKFGRDLVPSFTLTPGQEMMVNMTVRRLP